MTAVLDSLVVGDRVVLRTLLPDGTATDVIGWVAELPFGAVVVDGLHRRTTVQRSAVVAARLLPAAVGGPGPQRTTPEDLELVALPAWVYQREPLGAWTLRAAAGFTHRANSCLAVGDPGMALGLAARRIVAYAGAHQIPAEAQVVEGSRPERELRALGWQPVEAVTEVLAVRLGELLGARQPDMAVVSESLEEPWWQAYLRSRPVEADPAMVRAILSGGEVAFGSVRLGSEVVAIGRAHRNGQWAGFSEVWTVPELHGHGYATTVVRALGYWAARRGVRNAYLQVSSSNEVALRTWQRLGLRRHHGYCYLAPGASAGP